MKSLNKCQLIGNLGKEPEIIHFENGNNLAKFSVATSESYKTQDGQNAESTTWHNVVAWGKLADVIEKWVKKGDKVFIEGKMTNRSWEDKDGNKRSTYELVVQDIILLTPKKPGAPSENVQETRMQKAPEATAESEDDLPF
jgi:single-strand DNA-binding protein